MWWRDCQTYGTLKIVWAHHLIMSRLLWQFQHSTYFLLEFSSLGKCRTLLITLFGLKYAACSLEWNCTGKVQEGLHPTRAMGGGRGGGGVQRLTEFTCQREKLYCFGGERDKAVSGTQDLAGHLDCWSSRWFRIFARAYLATGVLPQSLWLCLPYRLHQWSQFSLDHVELIVTVSWKKLMKESEAIWKSWSERSQDLPNHFCFGDPLNGSQRTADGHIPSLRTFVTRVANRWIRQNGLRRASINGDDKRRHLQPQWLQF